MTRVKKFPESTRYLRARKTGIEEGAANVISVFGVRGRRHDNLDRSTHPGQLLLMSSAKRVEYNRKAKMKTANL